MTYLEHAIAFFKFHGTKVLGFAQGTVAAVSGVSDVIPPPHLKYWLATSAVLTFWRGFVNNSNGNP